MKELAKLKTSKTLVLTFDQVYELFFNGPPIERRVKRDIDIALRLAWEIKDKSKVRFILHNDKERMDTNCCELIVTK